MLETGARTHVGKVRSNNEDNYLCCAITDSLHLLLVADGVGGNNCGEVASQMVVDVFADLAATGKLTPGINPDMRDALLNMAVYKAHHQVAAKALANVDMRGMSCTLTLVMADSQKVDFAQVGDSRLYHFQASSNALIQQSSDQTVAQALFEQGSLSASERSAHPGRNTLYQAIGVEQIAQPLAPVLGFFDWTLGDRLLLCSDGLSDMVSDSVIKNCLADNQDVQEAARALVDVALEYGGKDNVTVIVAANLSDSFTSSASPNASASSVSSVSSKPSDNTHMLVRGE